MQTLTACAGIASPARIATASSAQPLQRRPHRPSGAAGCSLRPIDPEPPVQGHTVPWRESAHQKHALLRSPLREIAARKANLLRPA